ncbi:MAG: hypothetical protein ACPL7I_06165, partial [Myxococcota bacterium]
MAPEQRRDAKRVDSRADIFSLGITLYEMLSGEVPQGNFKRICQLRNDVNPAIDAVIEKAIASKPTDRYQSSDEMTVAIRAALVENEKKTVLSTDDIADKKEIIEVKSYTDSGRERSLKRYLIFGIISGLIIVIVISLLIWFLR